MTSPAPEPVTFRPALRSFYPSWFLIGCLFFGGLALHLFFGAQPAPEGQISLFMRLPADLPFIGGLNLGTLSWIVMIMICIICLWVIVFRHYFHTWTLHPARLHATRGIIAIRQTSIYYENARMPTVNQGLIDRILRIGSVEISSAGTGDSGDFRMFGIPNPVAVKNDIMQRIEQRRGAKKEPTE